MGIKFVFCWTDINGYMAACWRALQQMPDIELYVIAFQARTESSFSTQLMDGIPCRLLDIEERQNEKLIKDLVLSQAPDVLYLCGWWQKPIRKLAFLNELQYVPLVMGMDTPWQGTWRQRLAPWALRSYLKRMTRVVVIGERSWQYASRLGIEPAKLMRGLCGIDYSAWAPLLAKRLQLECWPHSFLFVGRYAPEKALDVMVEAYRVYRNQVDQPWNLICCGLGPQASLLKDQPGVEDRGFVQPVEMQAIWQNAGTFLLPSRFDPWPLALVEAAAAGLPIICTDVCGSAVEVVRPGYNGLLVPQNDAEAFAKAMFRIHQKYDQLHIWGARSQQLAAPYAAEVWAERWHEMICEVAQIAGKG